MRTKTKSPIKTGLLRQAGESLRKQQLDLLFDQVLPVYLVAGALWLIAIMEWIWFWQDARPNPLYLTIISVLFTLYAVARLWKPARRLINNKLGYDGERVVGEYIDRLRLLGYRVYHDVPGARGNIDHVIISTRGAYCIETKTRSKPEKGQCKILYNGLAVSTNSRDYDESPIIQAKAQAKQLKRLLKEETGKDYPVQPVVVYPGWFIEEATTIEDADVWVMTPTGLPKRIERQVECVPISDVKMAASKLAAYIRTS